MCEHTLKATHAFPQKKEAALTLHAGASLRARPNRLPSASFTKTSNAAAYSKNRKTRGGKNGVK
jgi:hypothetical protein